MLHMVGIPDERIVVIPPDALVEADELIVPQPWPLVFSPYTLQIYDEMANKVAAGQGKPTRRLLISREQRTSWRNMLTYDAVREMLIDRYKFEVLRPELLSLEDEIRTYRDAAMMIGAEGAGLYSAVYARPGQTFMAIGDEDYIMPILGSAASGRGFDVAYVFGESVRADSDVERRQPAGHSDFVVDPNKVAELVDRVMAIRGDT
jgi:capsular polysaccharide biosynthesis protein